MIELVLVRFLRDHTPHKAGATAAFSPAVAENFKKNRVVEIIGPLKEELAPESEKKGTRTKLEK
jgi:hypothetical protein